MLIDMLSYGCSNISIDGAPCSQPEQRRATALPSIRLREYHCCIKRSSALRLLLTHAVISRLIC